MSGHWCDDSGDCALCDAAITRIEDERTGLTDTDGAMADAAADDYYLGEH